MDTNECSQPASKSSWDSQDFGDISMVLKMAHFRKSTGPRWVKTGIIIPTLKKATLDPNVPNKYRLITLSSTHGKLIEFLILP